MIKVQSLTIEMRLKLANLITDGAWMWHMEMQFFKCCRTHSLFRTNLKNNVSDIKSQFFYSLFKNINTFKLSAMINFVGLRYGLCPCYISTGFINFIIIEKFCSWSIMEITLFLFCNPSVTLKYLRVFATLKSSRIQIQVRIITKNLTICNWLQIVKMKT